MKKIIFSLLFVGMLIVGCADFDKYTSEDYGSGPAVELTVSSIQDSSFVVNIAPAPGTKYYAYWIVEGKVQEDINPQNLLKTAYAGSVGVDATETHTLVVTYEKGLPFKTYQIYAVASTDKGTLGAIAHQSVTTTDGETPIVDDWDFDPKAPESLSIVFSEEISRGEGDITITLFKRYDLLNPETIVLDEESIAVDGKEVMISLPDDLPGIYFAISWPKGAFVDLFENPTPVYNSGLDSGGEFYGIYGRIPTEPFAIEEENMVELESDFFSEWEKFEVELAFDFDIYPNNSAKQGAIKAVYFNANKTVKVNLTSANWTIAGQSLKFTLPEAPQLMDSVSFIIESALFYDVYGNPNDAYAPEAAIACYRNDFKKEDFFGNFSFTYGSAYEDPEDIFDGGSFTIEEDDSEENAVILKGFYLGNDAEDIPATYDVMTGKLLIPDMEIIGLAGPYLLVTYNLEVDGPIEFVMQGDKSLVCASMMGIVAADPDTYDLLGYWDKLVNATMTPKTAMPVGAHLKKANLSHKLHTGALKAKKK